MTTVRPNGPIIASPNRGVELRGPFSGRLRVAQEPDVWQQLRQPVGRSGWKPPKHIRQVAEGADPVPLATCGHAEQ